MRFDLTADAASSVFTPLLSAGGVTYELRCEAGTANTASIFASATGGGTAVAGGTVERADGSAVAVKPTEVFRTALGASRSAINVQTTTTSPETTAGHWSISIDTPTTITVLDLHLTVAAGTTGACTIHGSAITVAI